RFGYCDLNCQTWSDIFSSADDDRESDEVSINHFPCETVLADELLCSLKILNVIEAQEKSLQSAIRKQEKFNTEQLFLRFVAYPEIDRHMAI
uniref:hypothetical protein n=1 Tax=Oceanospirillum beijerinckii TaxID=64976 RepID=UPI000488E047